MVVNTLIIFSLLFTLTISSDLSPAQAPSPVSGADEQSAATSPPLPPPESDLSPSPASPASSPTGSDGSVSPDLAPNSEFADVAGANLKTEESSESKSDGMSGGKKAGIVIGVIAAACVVVCGGVLYKKRQQNIRRAEFSQAARREFL